MHSWVSPHLVGMLEEVIETAIDLAGADFGNVQLLTTDGRLGIVAQRNFPEWWIAYWDTVAQGQGACGVALEQSRRVCVEDVELSPIFVGTPALEIQRRAGVRAVHSIPLLNKHGQCLGMFSTHYRVPHTPAAATLRVLDLLASHACTLAEHARDEHLRYQSEVQLGRALALLEGVTAGADLLIAMIDREFRYTYFNARHHEELRRLTGKKTALGMSLMEVLSDMPEERDKALDIWQRALCGETVVEQIQFGAPRYRRWYSTLHIPIRDAAGQVIGAGEITTDITDRSLAEQALKARDDELAKQGTLLDIVMKTTDVMLVLLDHEFNFLWVNEAYAATCGMQPAELVGRNHFALFPNAENEAIFRRVRDTGNGVFFKDKPFEFPDQPERGTTYWDWSLVPVMIGTDQVNSLVFSLRETTSYKQTELALASSEQRYRSLVEQVPDGIFVADASGRYTDVNQAGAEMLGYSRDEILGMTIPDILFPEEAARLPNEIARFADGIVVRSEWHFRRKDGSSFHGEVHGRRLPDGQLQAVLRDISERRQAEEERLAALARQRDALVQEVHHRIKNHLHGVMGLLSAESAAHPALAAPLAEVTAQIKSIATVYGLLALQNSDRLELGQMVGLLAKGGLGTVPVVCHSSVPEPVQVAETVSVPLALAINELIVNAQKHIDRPDPQWPVRITLAQDGAGVRLQVCNGPARLPDGFDFERQEKTGLGLELVATLLINSQIQLHFEQRQDEVCAVLWLAAPEIQLGA